MFKKNLVALLFFSIASTIFAKTIEKDFSKIAPLVEVACKSTIETSGNQTICQCIHYRIHEFVGKEKYLKHVESLKKYKISLANEEDREFLMSISSFYKNAIRACWPL